MAQFLLIHGSCHGAWCWRDVLPRLEGAGHQARAIDLPSHGDDKTPYDQVTLDSYADAILAAIDDPVVLVGHSMAGFPISLVAEKQPDKITKLIYLCAYAPVSGKSLVEMRQEAPRQPLLDAVTKTPDGLAFTVDPQKAEQVFYHDCPPGTVAFANARLCPQAILPQATPIELTSRFGSVPKAYIRCRYDGTIPPEYQVTMTAGWPADQIHTLPSGHSPFFAMPDRLVECLIRIAR